jgi:DNA polymerase-3 subunit gamma/tau
MRAMSTVVLARKYRPRSFAQMAGQEHVVRALGNALRQQRLHHAYLFTGTRGIGKTTVSRILAKSLNCTGANGQGGITDTPCGVCTACVEIDQDRFIDYLEMDAASNRGIDEVRDMIERAAYKPSVGRFKVFMIDEAHQLTKEAFNALLKTLEEPPPYLKFVLATTDPDKMLPTVLSRCLQFNLRPMAPDVIQAHLRQILQAESVSADDPALQLIARAARGSMRDALSLTDQAIAYGGGAFDGDLVRGMLGLAHAGAPLALLDALACRDAVALLELVDDMRLRHVSFETVLEQMAACLQQVAVEQQVPGSVREDDPQAAALAELAPRLTPEELHLLYGIVLRGREELALMPDPGAAFTMVLLRYLAFPPVPTQVGVPPRAAALRASPGLARSVRAVGAAAVVPAPLPPASPPHVPAKSPAVDEAAAVLASKAAAPSAVATDEISGGNASAATDEAAGRWHDLCRQMHQRGLISGLVKELAWQGLGVPCETSEAQTWQVTVEHEALRSAGLRDKLCAALAEVTGAAVRLELLAGRPAQSPARRDAAERERRLQAAQAEIQQDTVVRSLLAQFAGAQIVAGSIKPH